MRKRPACLCTGKSDVRCDSTHCDKVEIGKAFDIAKHCRPCWLYHHYREYNLAYGGNGNVAQAPDVPLPRTSLINRARCVHLGKPTGELRVCELCGDKTPVPLRKCDIHGVCTDKRLLHYHDHAKEGSPLIVPAWCRTCKDHRPAPSILVSEIGGVRHLLYHVFPHAANGGAIWRWNVAKLKRRLSLFNGRRVVGIAVDGSTEPASAVRDALDGCGCEFVEVANNPALREGTTFHSLHERVAEFTGPEHATFFGHAKGVTSEAWAAGARRWTEAMYSACLDYWPEVRRLLIGHPLVGPFKRVGNLFPEAPESTWHYSGSFRWFRNADVFRKSSWRDIDKVWIGVESWPSKHFEAEDGAVLIDEFPQTGLALYADDFWRERATPAVTAWHEAHIADRWNPLLLTCVLISHRKPGLVDETIRSIQEQTSPDWRLVVVDSGELFEGLKRYESDSRVSVVMSPDGARCQGWQTNEVARRGLIVGDLVHYMTDDDLLDPGIFAAWQAAARSNPEKSAWFGPAERAEIRGGQHVHLGTLDAAAGERLNGRIDGIQACHRRGIVAPWPEGEDRETRAHADGLYLDALQAATTVHRIGETVGVHRHTPVSEFTKSSIS